MTPIVILTATILPHATHGIYCVNQTEQQRYMEYKRNLAFLARSKIFKRIVFLENSRSQYLSELCSYAKILEGYGSKMEVYHYPIADESIVLGKGYGEGCLIKDFLLAQNDIGDNQYFLKITGRYKVINIRRLVRSFMCGLMEYPSIDFIGAGFRTLQSGVNVVSTAVLVSKVGFWKEHLIDSYMAVDDKRGLAFEAVIRRVLDNRLESGNVIGEFELPIEVCYRNTATNSQTHKTWEANLQAIKSLTADIVKPPKKIFLRHG